jgi:hypothetical protein
MSKNKSKLDALCSPSIFSLIKVINELNINREDIVQILNSSKGDYIAIIEVKDGRE